MFADLKPHQLRVIAEKDRLDAERSKLTAFMKSPDFFVLVRDPEWDRLYRQRIAMGVLSLILGERIAAF